MTLRFCTLAFFCCVLNQSSVGQPDSLVFYQDVSWSPDGARLLLSRMVIRGDISQTALVSIDSNGADAQFLTSGPSDKWTSWSPEGSVIAYSSTVDGNTDIYTMRIDDRSVTRLTTDPGVDTHPDWSPDGSAIAFAGRRDGVWQILTMRPDGMEEKQLTTGPGDKWNPRWSSDGSWIAFYGGVDPGFDSIYVMQKDGSQLREVAPGIWPSWIPDTTQILFVDDGNAYRMNMDGTDRRFMIARTIYARWSPDGTRIAFVQETWRHPSGWPAGTALFLINADGSGRRKLTDR